MTLTTPSPSRTRRRGPLAAIAATTLTLVLLAGSPVAAQDASGSPAPPGGASSTEVVGIDGTWTVDTSLGDFRDFTSAWVGFRVAEVLERIGEAEAVGRTPLVDGALVISGTVLESARIEADLTGLVSDQSRRDPAIQRALRTSEFPLAVFESSGPVDLGSLPVEGETFVVSVPGTLTIHGVSQDVTVEMSAQQVGELAAAVGTLPIDFTSFGIEMPTAPIVVSVEDAGSLEWQLFFRRSPSDGA